MLPVANATDLRLTPPFLLLACGGSRGTLTVEVEGLTGATDLLLITEARDEEGKQAAISCVTVDADPFDASTTLEAIVGETPCEDSDPIDLAAGVYQLTTATIAGGAEDPTACAAYTAEVDGDVTVVAPELGDCG